MTLKVLLPSEAELVEARRSIQTFPGAVGSFGFDGKLEVDPVYPARLWLLFPATDEQISNIWDMAGFPVKGSSYPEIMAHAQKLIRLEFFKAKTGLFARRWVGNFWIWSGADFDIKLRTNVGSVGGDTQAAMWSHFRMVILGKEPLFKGTVAAIG